MIFALAIGGCGTAPTPEVWATVGCDWVRGRCGVTADEPLVVWIEGRGATRVDRDGVEVEHAAEPVEGGIRVTVAAPAEPGRWAFELDGAIAAFDVDRVERVDPGDCETVLGALAVDGDLPSGDAWSRAAACARREGDRDGMSTRLERAVERHRTDGEDSRAAKRTAPLVHRLLEAHELSRSEPWVRGLPEVPDGHRLWIGSHYESRLAELRGLSRRAEVWELRALSWARRLGLEIQEGRSVGALALLAHNAGDHERAARLLESAPTGTEPCREATRQARWNAAWYRLRGAIADGRTAEQAEILQIFEDELRGECHSAPDVEAEYRLDLAIAVALTGLGGEVRPALPARKLLREEVRPWARWLAARRVADPVGLREAIDAADRFGSAEVAMRALADLAALEGDDTRRQLLYEEGRHRIVRKARTLPWERDRGAWLASVADFVGQWASWLGERDPGGALDLVRRHQSLALRSSMRALELEESEDTGATATELYWGLRSEHAELAASLAHAPEDERPGIESRLSRLDSQLGVALEGLLSGIRDDDVPELGLGDGEVVLGSWPLGDQRLVFVAADGGVKMHRLRRQPTESEWTALLAGAVDAGGTLRVLGLGPDARAVLPTFLRALGERPTRWSLDLGAPPRSPGVGRVVVADSRGDLPSAREEAREVAGKGDTLLVGDDATVSAVREALEGADGVHLSLHGSFDPDHPEASHLALADGVLRGTDVLALSRVPREVFLSGCETGRRAHSLGLAQIFVAAGASVVVASDRKVSDADTRLLVAAWNRADGPPARRLAEARSALARRNPQADWTAWRLWTP